jgi:hypothetical protein
VEREEAPGHIQPLKLVPKGEKANCERFDIMLYNFIAAAVPRPGAMLTAIEVTSSSGNCIQWNLDLLFFKGMEKQNDECGKTINPGNYYTL